MEELMPSLSALSCCYTQDVPYLLLRLPHVEGHKVKTNEGQKQEGCGILISSLHRQLPWGNLFQVLMHKIICMLKSDFVFNKTLQLVLLHRKRTQPCKELQPTSTTTEGLYRFSSHPHSSDADLEQVLMGLVTKGATEIKKKEKYNALTQRNIP